MDNEADADIVVIPYWVDLLCRMSQESELLWDEFNKASAAARASESRRATPQLYGVRHNLPSPP